MKKQKIIIILMLVTTLFALSVNATEIELGEIEYKDSDLFFTPGNVTLTFNDSDTGDNDLQILWRIYSPENNLTIFYLKSKTILYDTSFINNTKGYYYKDGNQSYVVYVDYSSINVPKSVEELLNESLVDKNAEITALKLEKKNLSALLNSTIAERDQWKNTAQTVTTERDNALAENQPLKNQITSLEDDLSFQQNRTRELNDEIMYKENEIDSLKKTIKELKNPWCTGYTYAGQSNGFHINYSSLLIGGILIFIIVLIINSISDKKGIRIDLKRGRRALGDFHPIRTTEFIEDAPRGDPTGLQALREKEKQGETKEEPEQGSKEKTKEKPKAEDVEKKVDQLFNNYRPEVQ